MNIRRLTSEGALTPRAGLRPLEPAYTHDKRKFASHNTDSGTIAAVRLNIADDASRRKGETWRRGENEVHAMFAHQLRPVNDDPLNVGTTWRCLGHLTSMMEDRFDLTGRR